MYDNAAVKDLQWVGNDSEGAKALLDECGVVDSDGDGWRVAGHDASLRPIFERGEDRSVKALVEDYAPAIAATAEAHRETLDYVRAEVGKTSAPLHSYFALVADDPSVQLVSLAQLWHVAHLLSGTEPETLTLQPVAAPVKAGGGRAR